MKKSKNDKKCNKNNFENRFANNSICSHEPFNKMIPIISRLYWVQCNLLDINIVASYSMVITGWVDNPDHTDPLKSGINFANNFVVSIFTLAFRQMLTPCIFNLT